jgi:hypothetical protein
LNGDSVSAFKYPDLQLVGTFQDPQWSQSTDAIQIAARGDYLFAGFQMNVTPYPAYIDVWSIDSGCTMTLQWTYPATSEAPQAVLLLAVTPDGKTLLPSYGTYQLDSFSIGSDGKLTEHGPYGIGGIGSGIDVTSDGQFALFGVEGSSLYDYTEVAVFPIRSDGSLGLGYNFGGNGILGPGQGTRFVWLSPDEKFLFVTDIISKAQRITTLNFTESPVNLTYTGCIAKPRNLQGLGELGAIYSALPSGSGGGLYAAEDTGAVGLFSINSTTGCLQEIKGSPFAIKQPAETTWVTAWPPRPF